MNIINKFSAMTTAFCAATLLSAAGPVAAKSSNNDHRTDTKHQTTQSAPDREHYAAKKNQTSYKKSSQPTVTHQTSQQKSPQSTRKSSQTSNSQKQSGSTPKHYQQTQASAQPVSAKPASKASNKTVSYATATTATTPTNTKTTVRGNNGTVKIDGEPFDTHPNNEPHVGCNFQTDFYNYDKGSNLFSNSVFTAHKPTGTGVLLTDRVFVGEDPAGGGHDVDAQPEYNLMTYLSNYTPHPKQGYHVKLSTNTEGTPGGAKHKVFWIKCTAPTTPPIVTPPTTTPPTTTPPTTTTPPQGGRGGGDIEVIPTSISVNAKPIIKFAAAATTKSAPASAVASANTTGMQLPGTGKEDSVSLWMILSVIVLVATAVYWRTAITPALRR